MKSNVSLIGMPGAGKSTVGIILAKNLSFGFIDTDVIIQMNRQKSLQQLMDEKDHIYLRSVEECEILNLHVDKHVIATGGSAVYSEKAMAHLLNISTVVLLEADFEEIERRIHNFADRGIAKSKDQTFRELFDERRPLYKRYAEISIDCNHLDQEETAAYITKAIRGKDA